MKDNPFKGIYCYERKDEKDFHGRDTEIQEITDIVLYNNSTILTGYSGCGKTSLINAGVIPSLQRHNYYTVSVSPRKVFMNIDRDDFAITFWERINDEINAIIEKEDIITEDKGTTLWEKIFLNTYTKTDKDNKTTRVFFVIVLDQFEELFQLNLNIKEINKFFRIYEILCDVYAPYYDYIEILKTKTKDGSSSESVFPESDVYNDYYTRLSTYHRFVISLRKDFLFDLQSYSSKYPILAQNIYFVEYLDDDQARTVILSCKDFKPTEDFVGLNTHKLISCILNEKDDFDDTDGKSDYRVDTMTLSVVLYKLWEDCYTKVKEQCASIEPNQNVDDTKIFQDAVIDINNKINKLFTDILEGFYNDRIDSLKYESRKRKEEKKIYIEEILRNHPTLSNLKIDLNKIFVTCIDYSNEKHLYSTEKIGNFIDGILYKKEFTDDYSIKECIKEYVKKQNNTYICEPDIALGALWSGSEISTHLKDKLDILFSENVILESEKLQAAQSINNMVYGKLVDSEVDESISNEKNIRQVLIDSLKGISLFDSINRCKNFNVRSRLLQHFDQIVCDLQEKLLSDSGSYRQSAYIDDICKLFDNAIYGKIDFERQIDWFCQLIKDRVIDICNGLFEICNTQYEFIRDAIDKNIVENIIKDNDFTFWKGCIEKEGIFEPAEFVFLDNDVIDKNELWSSVKDCFVDADFKINNIYENNNSHEIFNLKLTLTKNRSLIFYSIRIQEVLCYLIKQGKVQIELIESNEDQNEFRKRLNKYVYCTQGGINGDNVRDEVASVIRNCKLFTVLNRGSKENMLEFRHDRLCEMAKKNIEIYKKNKCNAKRFTPDIYFTPQGRLKENNCYVEWFLGPWNTYSTVMSSMYFLRGDMGNIVDFDTDCISQLKKINYDNASSAIVTIALNERLGENKYEYYHDLPAYFTHFRVKVEYNKIYNISFETRENYDSNVKKVVISTGFHKVRFYYDKYDRIVLKEFCVRKDKHADFYLESLIKVLRDEHRKEDEIMDIIKKLPRDIRVILPEVGYNAIYYKYDKITYKCPSETYFLNIPLDDDNKDLRIKARNEISMSKFYQELDADIKSIKELLGQNTEHVTKYVVKHIVDGNYGYKSRYDKFGREISRLFVGGTVYGFNMIKFEYDNSDNVKSIAFFNKNSNIDQKNIKATYYYPYKSLSSGIHKIELKPGKKVNCKETKYYDEDDNPCFDKFKRLRGKKYTYYTDDDKSLNNKNEKCILNANYKFIYQNKKVKYNFKRKRYISNAEYNYTEEHNYRCRVQTVRVSKNEDARSAVVLSIESLNAKRKKIDGRRIVKNSNIFDYESQRSDGNVVLYDRIEFKYTRGIVKTHIFTTKEGGKYKYFINRHGDVCEKESDYSQIIPIRDLSVEMIYVEGGVFKMGHGYDEDDYPYHAATPVHKVRVSDFYIGKTTVTYQLWSRFMPVQGKMVYSDSLLPVVNVTWTTVCEFIEKLNDEMKFYNKKHRFRLPTEAEWEYAARGGQKEKEEYKYSGSDDINKVAFYNKFMKCASIVGENGKKANALGIHDMSGNVKEWCSDYFGEYAESDRIVDNPIGPSIGYARVVRGGGYQSHDYTCRVYNRDCSFPDYPKEDIGFRLVLEIDN